MLRKSLIALAIGTSLGLSAPAIAAGGSTSSIYGVVDSQSGGELTVTAKNPQTGFSRTVSVNDDGSYRLAKLDTGTYQIVIKRGDSVVAEDTLRVTLGSNKQADFNVAAMNAERIEVTGARISAIDLSSTDSGLILGEDEIDRMPIARNITAVALLAPGVVQGDSGFGNVASFGGASVAENACYINGLEVTDTRQGLGCGAVPFEMYKEFQVKTGGFSAEYGRATGGLINAVTKSGTNEWEFDFTANWEPSALQEEGTFDRGRGGTGKIFRDNRLDEKDEWDYSISAAGPIIEDKLFFYALVNPRSLSRDFSYVSGSDEYTATDQFRTRESDGTDNLFWGAKVDWDIIEGHRLSYFAYSDQNDATEDVFEYDPETQTIGDYSGSFLRKRGGEAQSLTYTGYLTDNLSVSAMWGEIETQYETAPTNLDCPTIADERDGGDAPQCGPGGSFGDNFDENTQYRLDIEYYWGDHLISAGIDKQDRATTRITKPVGGHSYRYFTLESGSTIQGDNGELYTNTDSGAQDLVSDRIFDGGGSFESNLTAYYLEDKWQVTNNLMLSIGIRKDLFEGDGTTGKQLFDFDTDIAPRLGFTWDVLGNGESKLYGNYGRYYLPIANNTIYRAASGVSDTTTYYTFDDIDSVSGAPVGIAPVNGSVENSQTTSSVSAVPTKKTFQAQEADPFARDEFILGYQFTVNDSLTAEITGTYREVTSALDDYCGIYAYPYCVMLNPGEDMSWFKDGYYWDGEKLDESKLNLFDGEADEGSLTTHSAETLQLPEGKNEYTSVQFKLNYIEDNYRLNFQYTWARSVGNFEGAVKSDIDQADAGITQDFDFPALMDGADGYQPNDRRHTFKLYGSYDVTEDLVVGFNSSLQSGRPLTAFGQSYPSTDPNVYGSYGDTYYIRTGCSVELTADDVCAQSDKEFRYSPRGTAGRTPWTFNLDVSAAYNFSYQDVDMRMAVNVFNVLNTQEETATNEHYEIEEGSVNQYYGAAYSWQAPRSVRLSFEARY
ncbi:TonB-dependent receptor [Alteromonas lipotrueiana]|uniref:TonB-dependent receptor n=1 Tax=Alteromonas lipotrueiana TaxID=2803815 RepID=UPI001C48F07D|nr:TonB-dependent receptor [Alteromonas lipotrueiana]